MNRRGELERTISAARIGAAPYGLFMQLLRRSGNGTGEIDDGKYTPRLAKLADQAKMSRATGYRALAELIRHGWLVRYETADREKVAGLLGKGRGCDCAGDAVAVCQGPGCSEPLTNKRCDARYHADRCRKASQRRRAVSVTRTIEPAASLKSADVSAIERGHVRDISRTASLTSPDNLQVTCIEIGGAHIEIRDEKIVERNPANDDLVPNVPTCPFCDQTPDPTVGFLPHREDCWRGAVWKLYEEER
ncbi:MAG: hypothetical protein ACLP52_24710 [Streptosporangiaceae bacterium]|jgi:hypothetical protein